MKKRLLARTQFLLLLLLISAAAFTQTKVITGKVTDAKDGSPMAGVSVVPKGSTHGTTTGPDGVFRLTVGNNVTVLRITFVGFLEKEVPAGDNIQVSLAAGNASLNEVVVIGYGTQRKKDLTGAVTTVTAKDFQQGSITSPEQMIAGKVPGV